jgi:hypothetical protein
MHAYERCTPMGEHAYEMASVRSTPMRDTPIYIGWRKEGSLRAGGVMASGGVEGGSADLSHSTRRE